MRAWWLPLSLAFVLSGCADPAAPVPETVAEAGVMTDPWSGADRVEVAAFHFSGLEADTPLCTNAGMSTTAPEFPRLDRVHPGTDHLEITVSAEPTMTGVQVGYRSSPDAEDYTWLPVVFAATETFTVPVTSEDWEAPVVAGADEVEDADDVESWAFNHRLNLPGPAAQDCWTGGGTGRFDVTVEAVKGT
jgi:hypothetical protein